MKECVYVQKQSKLQCMNVAQSANINKRLEWTITAIFACEFYVVKNHGCNI